MSGRRTLFVPRRAPSALRSTEDLRALQRFMAAALRRRLAPGERMQARWTDGRAMTRVAGEFMKPNDRLTSFERLEIYNRQYWFRLLESFREDAPGLFALLGERRFWRLAEAYLEDCPPHSYTLRDLFAGLASYLRAHPSLTSPLTREAVDVARFEWAQIVAFDGPSRPPVPDERLARSAPGRLRLGIQPYVTLLELGHAVDDYVIAVKQRDGALRSGASNAVARRRKSAGAAAAPELRRERVRLAVHRVDNQVYFKRLDAVEFRLLRALRAGRTLARACEIAFRGSRESVEARAARVQSAFAQWRRLGWICAPVRKR